jgi:hypothetical protein
VLVGGGVSTGEGRAYMYFYGRVYAQIQRGAYMHWREGYIYVELVGLIKVVEYSWLEGVREEYEQVRDVRGGGARTFRERLT